MPVLTSSGRPINSTRLHKAARKIIYIEGPIYEPSIRYLANDMRFTEEQYRQARRRKSRWNLLLIPAVLIPLIVMWVALVLLGAYAHGLIHNGQTLRTGRGLGPILDALAPMFIAVPLGMLAGNLLVWCIAPARHALEREAMPYPALRFAASQSALLKLLPLLATVSISGLVLGVLLPW